MASGILSVLHTVQSTFAAYNLYVGTQTVSNLLEYEEKSKKAAEYSNVAENQLYKTRTTQATSIASVLLTFVSSAYLIFSNKSKSSELVTMAINLAVLTLARQYIGNFWDGKAKVPLPGVGKFNDAISMTKEVRLNMLYLAGTWLASGLVSLALL
ncbi:hypothetical protein PVAG01_08383 [Phlyctema vagabunda]|uniref:DUF1772 domain-containing protein n=1 Tax=Phlyctema vagabunda TaxID=108571 RepID=A0ABR4P998_9HELO